MAIARKGLLCSAFLLMIGISIEASACTSFKLETDQGLFFAHSLNQGSAPSVPGLIFINQRDAWKKGYSWEILTKVNDDSPPSLVWRSTFGSVTFNTFGRDLPDGGMNEAGLYIWEMGFDTEYPADENKPTLFQAQWMQYVLDNFSTIGDVIQNASDVCLDGWGWHYFVADKSGQTAIIDFIGGETIVHSGEDMPIPLCCNSYYPKAMKWLSQHAGFGGELEIRQIHEEIPRFIYGAKLIQEFESQDPADYSFHILDEMSNNVRWAIVFDVANMTAHFKTNLNQDVRQFAVTPDDFARADGPLMLDIECPGPANIRDQFVPYDRDMEKQSLTNVFELLCDMGPYFRTSLLEDQGVELDQLVESVMKKIEQPDGTFHGEIQGQWTGTVTYPAGDEVMELPMTLLLRGEKDQLAGTVDDTELLKNLPMTNIVGQGGLLSFTIQPPDTDDLLFFQMHATTNELSGAIEILGKQKKGTVSLSRVNLAGK